MDSQDQSRASVSRLVAILRKTTQVVRYAPFVYLLVYTFLTLTEWFIPEGVLCLFDSFLYASPVITAGMLFFSRLLSMCKWHRLACLLPTSSQATNFVDSYFFTFTQEELVLINTLIGVVCIAMLILIHKRVFSHA